ncbi:beta-taxilin-like [Onychostoma macrolepis]|uniref:beta-taxilin-like n=1 Tax=Onychostoma macrolepis TaxID=369639 RepID=UPI00272BAA06|nr:beta-taxilin-like [Onychostoma macrolepis]
MAGRNGAKRVQSHVPNPDPLSSGSLNPRLRILKTVQKKRGDLYIRKVGRFVSEHSLKNMANTTEIVDDNSILRTDFIQELLPSAERTSLLYHLAFLSLGGFPQLERVIRDQAIETQLLFGSSEALLMMCVGTCSNLVTSLFPILKKAVEKNKPVLAVRYLMKAKEWISDIVAQVDVIVKRYDRHNESVKKSTSDVYQEQDETKEKKAEKSDEMKGLEDALAKLGVDLKRVVDTIEMNEEQIKKTTDELNDFIRRFQEEHAHWTMKFLDCFRGYPDAMKEPSAIALDIKLKQLDSEKSSLKNEEWNIKTRQLELQLQLANCQIQMGEIPDPEHLKEVQKCLSQIQQILVDLKKFWEKVDAILKTLKNKTFVGEELVDMEDMKDEFLSSIDDAGKYWKIFGLCCQRVQGVFSIQSKDAYKFLEINPSSLSEEERNQQYESIMEKLKKINPDPPALCDTQE